MPVRRIVLAAVLGGCALCPLRGDALDALRAACPGIDHAAARLDIGPLLPAGWQKKASPTSCADLDALVQRYAGRSSSAAPAVSDLRTLALALQKPQSSADPFWKRIFAWLRHRFAPVEGLLKWFRSLPGWNVGASSRFAVLLGTSVLILLGAAAFIVYELRAAGLIGAGRHPSSRVRRRIARTRKAAGAGQRERDPELTYALDRPVLALRMLMDALRRSRRIERDGGLTCRELVARALFDTAGQRDGFAQVALLAERELYGPDGSAVELPDELRVSAQALYGQLLAAPEAARPATP